MIILTIRTDKPDAKLGLYDDDEQLKYYSWQGHRQLAETIHFKIKDILEAENLTLDSLEGIVAFKGPGSFTGLRIGLSVANALAASLKVPIVGTTGKEWTEDGVRLLKNKHNDKIVVPEYGAAPHITVQKK